MGATLAGSAEDLVDRLVATVGAFSRGFPLIGRSERVPTAGDAALINGVAGHAVEYDDSGLQAHATAPVAPAVLALAAEKNLTGRDFLTAFLAGLECELRIDEMTNPWIDLRAWHGTGVIGVFGAAAGCARVLGLNVDEVQITLGLAGVQASGLKWPWGSMAKSLQAGNAATRGVMAARLAQNGFTTYPDIIEGARGFGEMFVGEHFDPDAVIAKMMSGRNWTKSKYYGKTAEEIKAGWNANGNEASTAGTRMHLDIEHYNNAEPVGNLAGDDYEANPSKEWDYFMAYEKNHREPRGLEPFRTEWLVFKEDIKLAGSIDMVYMKPDGTLAIYDWKRAKSMEYENKFKKQKITIMCHYLLLKFFWHSKNEFLQHQELQRKATITLRKVQAFSLLLFSKM
jgi:hypothetical protein